MQLIVFNCTSRGLYLSVMVVLFKHLFYGRGKEKETMANKLEKNSFDWLKFAWYLKLFWDSTFFFLFSSKIVWLLLANMDHKTDETLFLLIESWNERKQKRRNTFRCCFSFFFVLLIFFIWLNIRTYEIRSWFISRTMKYILVTGGVISGIGKGIISSSVGTILRSYGFRVTSIKVSKSYWWTQRRWWIQI